MLFEKVGIFRLNLIVMIFDVLQLNKKKGYHRDKRRIALTSEWSARFYDGRVHSLVFILFLRVLAFFLAGKDLRDFALRS